MITRKAAIGFLILAVIIFPTAYFSWTGPIPEKVGSIDMDLYKHLDNSVWTDSVYRPPLVQFANPFDMAIVYTALIELITLICYLCLKKIEPCIKDWEESERERLKNQNSH